MGFDGGGVALGADVGAGRGGIVMESPPRPNDPRSGGPSRPRRTEGERGQRTDSGRTADGGRRTDDGRRTDGGRRTERSGRPPERRPKPVSQGERPPRSQGERPKPVSQGKRPWAAEMGKTAGRVSELEGRAAEDRKRVSELEERLKEEHERRAETEERLTEAEERISELEGQVTNESGQRRLLEDRVAAIEGDAERIGLLEEWAEAASAEMEQWKLLDERMKEMERIPQRLRAALSAPAMRAANLSQRREGGYRSYQEPYDNNENEDGGNSEEADSHRDVPGGADEPGGGGDGEENEDTFSETAEALTRREAMWERAKHLSETKNASGDGDGDGETGK